MRLVKKPNLKRLKEERFTKVLTSGKIELWQKVIYINNETWIHIVRYIPETDRVVSWNEKIPEKTFNAFGIF